MREQDDWQDMLSPEVKRYAEATTRAHLEERRMLLRFAPMLCRCRPWYDWRDPGPPQEDCYVHTTVMFGRRGVETI